MMMIRYQNVFWSTPCKRKEIQTTGEQPSFSTKGQGKDHFLIFLTFRICRLQNLKKEESLIPRLVCSFANYIFLLSSQI